LNLNIKELKMAEAKGLMKPVKLKNELAELLGTTELPRTEITKKLWDYIKANKLQTKTEICNPLFIKSIKRSLPSGL
jgi:chromatin remodeling complex protein RSC6